MSAIIVPNPKPFSSLDEAPTPVELAPRCLLHSSAWRKVLNHAVPCPEAIHIELASGQQACVHVFRKFALNVGYVDFPLGTIGQDAERGVDLLKRSELRHVALLRLVNLSNERFPGRAGRGLPRTIIDNLQEWRLENLSSSIRRNAKKASKNQVGIRNATDLDSHRVFQLYVGAVSKNGGTKRYTRDYFHALGELALENQLARVRLACIDERVVAFLATATHGDMTAYLHGGFDEQYQSARPMDALFIDAIQSARDSGSSRFDFLASPADQPNLVRFKEKWGGNTFVETTQSTFAKTLAGRVLKLAIRR